MRAIPLLVALGYACSQGENTQAQPPAPPAAETAAPTAPEKPAWVPAGFPLSWPGGSLTNENLKLEYDGAKGKHWDVHLAVPRTCEDVAEQFQGDLNAKGVPYERQEIVKDSLKEIRFTWTDGDARGLARVFDRDMNNSFVRVQWGALD